MAGDVVDLKTKAYYKAGPMPQGQAPVQEILNSLLYAYLGGSTNIINIGKGNLITNNNTILNATDLSKFISDNQNNNNTASAAPKAYLNYVLFDENLNFVNGAVKRINGPADQLSEYIGHMDIEKSGYLYVYTSNETQTDVWFDDVQ